MEFNKLVFGGLALGCLLAAGTGSYLAVRQNAVESQAAPVAAAPAAVPGQPVAESEGVIAPAPVAPPATANVAPAPAPAAPAAAPRRIERVRETPRPAATGPRTPPPSRTERAEAAPQPPPAPSGNGSNGSMWETRPAVEAAAPEREPEPPPAPPAPAIVDLVVPADSVLGLQVERTVTSETARVEDRVEARVTRDVRVSDRVAIPAGSLVQGSVTEVARGGKVKEQARLGVRFHTVVLADGTRVPIRTDAIVREGQSPAGESAAKIGGAAAGGAILGAILGGGKGAAIGGAIGAAGGTAATMAGGRNPAVLPQGTTVSVRIQQPVTVSVEQEERDQQQD
jgi:hypothetical protein